MEATPTATPAATPAVDGRRARRERGRLAVVDATIDLVLELHEAPSAEAIAERAGVSMSSLFRYFESLDELQQHVSERVFERYEHLFTIPGEGEGPLEARIARHVKGRIGLYETLHPLLRNSRGRSLHQPHLAEVLRDLRAVLRAQVRRHYSPELASRGRAESEDLVGVIATLTSFDSWDQLTGDLGRSRAQVQRAWSAAIGRLLGTPVAGVP